MNQVLKLLNKKLLFAIVLIAASCCYTLMSLAAEAQKSEEEQPIAEKYIKQENFLKKRMEDKTLWNDSKRKKELVRCLRTIATLRMKSVAPVIVSRITYNPDPLALDRTVRTLEVKYPVYGALKGIGIPSVPYLVSELKKTNPKDGTEESYLKQLLLIYCIDEIYDQGKHGTLLTKKRLQIELGTAKDRKAKANLKAALNHPTFKEDSSDVDKKKKAENNKPLNQSGKNSPGIPPLLIAAAVLAVLALGFAFFRARKRK